MMTSDALQATLEKSGLPVAQHTFPESGAPPLPYVCWQETDHDNYYADGIVFYQIRHIRVELYERYRSAETETQLEDVLDAADWAWTRTPEYIEDEQCWAIYYEFEV